MNESEMTAPETDAEALPDAAATGVDLEQEGNRLRAAFEELRLEADRYRDEALRARAELDNVRKRAQRDVEAAHKYGIERLAEAFVPVKDSLDLGFDATATTTDVKSLQEGMELTQRMFASAFDKLGVQVVNPEGMRFNPEHHQAVMMEASASAEPGTVLRVLQKGYLLHERLLRPAMVIVAKAPDGA